MKINICVPCYNESKRLPYFLSQIEDLSKLTEFNNHQVDFVFLNDGSLQDETNAMEKIIQQYSDKLTNNLSNNLSNPRFHVQILNFKTNRGKGDVLRDGFLQALNLNKYDLIGFMDGDGATAATELLKLVQNFINNNDLDLVIGSRWKALGYNVERSLKRHLTGRIFATLLSVIFKIPVYDSQCGAKLFKAQTLSPAILNFCYDNKWLFDTQLLISFYLNKKNIIEQPVNWKDQPGSKIHLLRDSWRMFTGLVKFKSYLKTNSKN